METFKAIDACFVECMVEKLEDIRKLDKQRSRLNLVDIFEAMEMTSEKFREAPPDVVNQVKLYFTALRFSLRSHGTHMDDLHRKVFEARNEKRALNAKK